MTVGELIKQLEQYDNGQDVIVINITPDVPFSILSEVFENRLDGCKTPVVCLQGE